MWKQRIRFLIGLIIGLVIGASLMWIVTENFDVSLGPLTHERAAP